MSGMTPSNAVYEKPKAVWVVGAWLSTLAAVLGAGMTQVGVLYGGVFAALVGGWVVYGAGFSTHRGRWVAFIFLCVWATTIPWWIRGAEMIVMTLNNRGVIPSVSRVNVVLLVLAWIVCFVSGMLAGLVTLHRRTTAVCAVASLLVVSLLVDRQSVIWASAAAWHAVVFGAIVLWAVRARTRRLSGSHCAGCGYDLAGIEGAVCPECGRARVTAGPARAA